MNRLKTYCVCFVNVLITTINTKYSEIWWRRLQNMFDENNQQILILEKKTRTSHRRLLMESQKPLSKMEPTVSSILFWTGNNLSPEAEGSSKESCLHSCASPFWRSNESIALGSYFYKNNTVNLITLSALMKLAMPPMKWYDKLLSHYQ